MASNVSHHFQLRHQSIFFWSVRLFWKSTRIWKPHQNNTKWLWCFVAFRSSFQMTDGTFGNILKTCMMQLSRSSCASVLAFGLLFSKHSPLVVSVNWRHEPKRSRWTSIKKTAKQQTKEVQSWCTWANRGWWAGRKGLCRHTGEQGAAADVELQPSCSACCWGGSRLGTALLGGEGSWERSQSKAARRIRALWSLTHKEGQKETVLCHPSRAGRCAGSFTNKLAQTLEARCMQQLSSTTRKRDLTPKFPESPM